MTENLSQDLAIFCLLDFQNFGPKRRAELNDDEWQAFYMACCCRINESELGHWYRSFLSAAV
jgi:hypothetical protein